MYLGMVVSVEAAVSRRNQTDDLGVAAFLNTYSNKYLCPSGTKHRDSDRNTTLDWPQAHIVHIQIQANTTSKLQPFHAGTGPASELPIGTLLGPTLLRVTFGAGLTPTSLATLDVVGLDVFFDTPPPMTFDVVDGPPLDLVLLFFLSAAATELRVRAGGGWSALPLPLSL